MSITMQGTWTARVSWSPDPL